MLKAIEKLLTGERTTVGNHSCVKYTVGDKVVMYFYHSTAICVVNYTQGLFYTDNGGWDTSSTNRAINDYVRHFEGNGFKRIEKSEASGWKYV